jgi:hypothetical protein
MRIIVKLYGQSRFPTCRPFLLHPSKRDDTQRRLSLNVDLGKLMAAISFAIFAIKSQPSDRRGAGYRAA